MRAHGREPSNACVPWLVLCTALLVAHGARAESSFEREIDLIAELLALQPDSVVADIGAGDGDYSIALAARLSGAGRVIATELEEEERAEIEAAAKSAGADRVEVVAAQTAATGLPAACCDAAFLRDVFHHITEPEPFLASLFETIRPGGRLLLIDFPPSFWLAWFTPEGIPEDRGGHGIPIELLTREAEAAGFVRIRTVDEWPSSNFVTRTYGVAFERP